MSVEEAGTGIQLGDEGCIFEKGYRDPVGSLGTGLGLVFAKKIVEAHGGRITFESQAERGSMFQFSLLVFKRDSA